MRSVPGPGAEPLVPAASVDRRMADLPANALAIPLRQRFADAQAAGDVLVAVSLAEEALCLLDKGIDSCGTQIFFLLPIDRS